MKKEKSLLLEFLGYSPTIKVLDFLLTFDEFDYPKKIIAINSKVAWNTINLFWNNLVEKKIVVKTRKVGKEDMYCLNKKNPIVLKLMELDKLLIKRELRGRENLKKVEVTRTPTKVEFKTKKGKILSFPAIKIEKKK